MKMKKFINKPEDLVVELMRGLTSAYSDIIKLAADDIIVRARPKEKGKTWIVFGQGAGHEPGFDGLIGYGMHDVEVPGGIFACAGGDRIYEGIKIAWEGSGHAPILVLVANHEGDVINNGIAVEMAQADGIDVESHLMYDDIASAPPDRMEDRRGMAGLMFQFKIAGAMSETGASRGEIIKKITRINEATRTLAVAMRPCTIPTTGDLLFELADDELVIGPGVHGEAGPEGPAKLSSANEVMDEVAKRIIDDGGYKKGDEVLVLVNGSGATTLMELFILYDRLRDILKDRGIKPYRPLIGNLLTTQEMAGFSLSMCRADAETKRLWDAPANTPFFKVV
jgi:dihydroxyacetone kinase-like protein